MTIAIDFDNTWTRNPEFWKEVVRNGREHQITFIIVTGRSNDGVWGQQVFDAIPDDIPIVFAGMTWKRDAAKRRGFEPDIWIDDKPEYIGPQEAHFVGPKLEASRK